VITPISVISVPTNVSLRVGDLSPFFNHPGEMTLPETTVDFATVLQGALASAKVENGFYDLPLTIHSDSIARLQIELDVEFLLEQNPLPGALPEVVLPFNFSTLAQSPAATLSVAVPPNMRVVPDQTTARVRGTFAESRVALPTRIGEVKPVAAVEVSATSPQTQFVATGKEITTTAIDLLLESTTLAARLRLDIRADLDGKPGDTSLLATPIEFRVDQEAGKGARWISVTLGSEFVFLSSQRYWLALQSLEGVAAWSVDKAPTGALNMQSTRDGGLSWRDSLAMAGTQRDQTVPAAGPFAAFFRLRTQPKTFKVPIELQVGRDETEVRVKLDRFEPLGRVDFALDTELAQGINEYLEGTTSAACPETEHLHNGDFEQWLRIGDDIKPQAGIRTGAPIDGLGFSPDGTLAYVLDQPNLKRGLILVIDTACNRLIPEKEIVLTINNPRAFVISPDGTRAFVIDRDESIDTQRLQVVDLSTGRVLGVPFDLEADSDESPANDLAISPDGTRLFVPLLRRVAFNENRIRVIDTAKLEQQLSTGVPVTGVMEKKSVAAHDDQERSPMSVAVSPDGRLLYMVTDLDLNTEVRRVDTNTLTLFGSPIPVGQEASSIAMTPDGAQAVVTNTRDDTISIINTQNSAVTTVPVGDGPIDVAISPDGTKTYVLNRIGRTISVADLSRHTVVGNPIPLPAGTSPTAVALALSPQGDQIYVANDEDAGANSFVSSIQFGTRVPGEWQLTSGAVGPFCPGDPFHLVAILGSDTMPTALSQVVPVTGSCTYEFSFWGLALDPVGNESPAMAEVLWFGKQCRPVGPNPDPIPIKVIENAPVVAPPAPFAAPLFARNAAGQTASLKFHRVRLIAPAGADQAEVRFSVSTGGVAAIDQISLIATLEAVANSDFQVRQNGQLSGWTISPAVAPGFAVLDTVDGGIQLRNSSAVMVELVQLVEAKKEEPFTIEIQRKTLAGSSALLNPEVEVRWFNADGKPTGSPTIVGLVSGAFASSTASGTAPGDATQAEIHLRLPARTTVEVKNISLRFTKPVIVPVSFIAQSPGELIVSDVRIAFERVGPKPPPISNRGLCPPTPPGREPGEGSHHCCFCTVCESEQMIEEMSEVSTEAGRPAMLARCMSCGTEFLRGSGVASTEPQPISHDSTLGSPIVVAIAASVASPLQHKTVRTVRLTDLHGIAERRARQLAAIGIDSVEKLAAATPETVAQIKFITLDMARHLVEQAKSLIPPTT
jgi:YVTN family beta-propeller protein